MLPLGCMYRLSLLYWPIKRMIGIHGGTNANFRADVVN